MTIRSNRYAGIVVAEKLRCIAIIYALLLLSSTLAVQAARSPTAELLESARHNADANRHCEIALKEADQVIAIQPSLLDAYLIKAKCEDYLFGADRAIATLELALHRNLQSAETWKTLGILFDAKRDYQQAINAYTRALAINPRDDGVLHLRGMAYTEIRRSDLAVADMSTCIKLGPTKSSHYQWRAFAYEQTHRWNEALADMNKAIALAEPSHKTKYMSHRAELYTKLNKLKEAISDYDTLLKANSQDDAFWLKRGDCCMALGNFKDAVTSYTETISLDESSTAYFARSKAYQKLGLFDLAAKDKATGDHLLKQRAINPI